MSWHARTSVYRKRDKKGATCCYLDLTKRRFKLNKLSEEKVKEYPEVAFSFADVNNNLCLCLVNGTVKCFNSEIELENILRAIGD